MNSSKYRHYRIIQDKLYIYPNIVLFPLSFLTRIIARGQESAYFVYPSDFTSIVQSVKSRYANE
jgi:hypothetical protein